jgi:hypothetical protein
MSSSNLVRIIGVPETTYGLTPALGVATEVLPFRFTSETLSGTPQTAESQEARADRMSGGQVVVGLNSGGDIVGEISQHEAMDQMMKMAMMSEWVAPIAPPAVIAATQTKDALNDQLALLVFTGLDVGDVDGTGTGNGFLVGDVITLKGFPSAVNNGPRQISQVTPPDTLQIIVPRDATTEATAALDTARPMYLDIGATVFSLTLSKSYEDLPHQATANIHSQRYTGAMVNQLTMQLAWGAIGTYSTTFVANGYLQELPSLGQQIETAGGTVPPAPTDQPLNASVDMPMLTVGGAPTDYCIQSLNFTLNNNLSPQNCMGKIAPTMYSLGTAAIAIQTTIYLGDASYDAFMPKKMTQEPVSILFTAANADGGYAFEFRAVQLSFPDPASAGRDQQTMINAEGVAKVGPDGTSALRIYKL